MRYAIVMTAGCYGSVETVRPVRVCGSPVLAAELAARWTRSHQRGMDEYGGTSGGYMVVEVDDSIRTRRDISWYGHELERS